MGDLAQFVVAQGLAAKDILEQSNTLAFPDSVVRRYWHPSWWFPGAPADQGLVKPRVGARVEGRLGQFMKDYDFDEGRDSLQRTYGASYITEKDLLSYALYPKVFEEWKELESVYGDVDSLPTPAFLNPMKVGQEIELDLGPGRSRVIKLVAIQDVDESTDSRDVLFEVNGEQYYMMVTDQYVASTGITREKVAGPGTVPSPMPGVVVDVKVKVGDRINERETVATLSAMKMETSVPATSLGLVKRVVVNVGDKVEGDDLLVEIE